jgi:hypothetical protein
MKKLVITLSLFSFLASAQTLEERTIDADKWCTKNRKVNLGVYKLDKGCEATLAPKKAIEISGICRGTLKRKTQDIDYKFSFNTKAGQEELKYVAVIDRVGLWNTEEAKNPEISFYQPTFTEHKNQRVTIVNINNQTTVTRGNETVVNLKSDDIDLLVIDDSWSITNIAPRKANIIVKTSSGTAVLENASCDLTL